MRELRLEELEQALNKGMVPLECVDRALIKAGLIIEEDAKRRCPIGRTGQLKNSIHYRLTNEGFERAVVVGSNLEYAPYVEYGTGIHAMNNDGRQTPWVYYSEEDDRFYWTEGQEPQPYLNPAFEENTERIKQAVANIIMKGIINRK